MDDDREPGDWALATWHCYYHAELHFVYNNHGKPGVEWHPTSSLMDAYRWNSYHAARKWQKANPRFRGYIIVNLRAIKAQCQRQRQIDEERLSEARDANDCSV